MFAKNLRYLREKNRMEQLELAEKLGKKSSSTISEWEKGKYTPRIGVLNDIAEIFDVSISDLMNLDLSDEDVTIDKQILTTISKLNIDRKQSVLSYAQEQLTEQDKKITPIHHIKDVKSNYTLAAHSSDPTKKYTDDEVENIKSTLAKARKKYEDKNK